MNGPEVIKVALSGTQYVLSRFIEDLSDADLLVRPVPNANHIAWQLGHLINSEPDLVRTVVPNAKFPTLPDGFKEQYASATASAEPPKGFLSKQQYLDLFNQVRSATIAAVGQLKDADLDKPTPGPMAPYAPTTGAMLMLVSNHTLMHAGQFSVARRKLGKPVLF